MTSKHDACRGPISRRSFLTMGTLGLGGLSLADAMRVRAAAGETSFEPDTSVTSANLDAVLGAAGGRAAACTAAQHFLAL